MSLAEFAKIYKETQAFYESKYINPPPGVYNCRVVDGEYKNIIKSDKDYDKFSWTLEVIDGDLAGQRFVRTEFLPENIEKSGKKLGFIKGSIERCGVCPPKEIMDLPLAMKKCTGAEIEVTITHSGEKTKEGKPILNIKFTKNISVQSQNDDLSRYDSPEFGQSNDNTVLY